MVDLAGYVLTFADEFNLRSISQTGTDTTWADIRKEWRFDKDSDIGFGKSSFVDSASGYDPFEVKDGHLVITAVPDRTQSGYPGSWESGLITTQGGFSQKYGYFEMRADMSGTKGSWDAFWLMPTVQTKNPLNPSLWQEVDVVEHYGNNDRGVYSAIHNTDPDKQDYASTQTYAETAIADGFHTYGLMWTEKTLSFYLDGRLTSTKDTPSDMHQPMYMLANLAVEQGADTNGPPISLKIDYIRAYAASSATVNDDFLVGTSGVDVLDGLAGDDTLVGAGGADTLTGDAGADVFAGTTAELHGDKITDFALGDRINVADAIYGSFSYTHIGSSLSFGGATIDIGSSNVRLVTAASAISGTDLVTANRMTGLNDFNGDGHSDILWRKGGSAFSTWGVSGNTSGNQFSINSTYSKGVETNWKMAETFDFNGDGRSDILWRDQNAGQFKVWNGHGKSWEESFSDSSVAGDWKIAGVGDLNGDGRDDVVWRHETGAFSTWQSTGVSFSMNVTYDASVSSGWKIVGLADFDGDGKDDLLWRHQESGTFTIWNSTGAGFTPNSYSNSSVDTTWHIDALADFNGDGSDDILWRHDGDGMLTVWQSTGTDFNANTFVDGSVNPVWQVANAGDFDNDGKADIMFRNVVSGTFTTWESNGNGFDPNVASVNSVGLDWQVQAHDYVFG